jgi:FKBP-type peptidyl-prolyl cis-trans isomerase SlyD
VSIAPDTHVTIRYALFEADGPSAAAEAPGDEPITVSYVHGYGQVLPAIENGLTGRDNGAHVTITAEAAEAFGPYESEGLFEIEKDGLDGADDLTEGEEVVASGPDGEIFMRVIEVRPDTLVVDTNHPLAGKRVRFEVDVLDVRPATEDEIEEAQAELDAHHSLENGDACGCGHDHGGASPDESPEQLLKLGTSRTRTTEEPS